MKSLKGYVWALSLLAMLLVVSVSQSAAQKSNSGKEVEAPLATPSCFTNGRAQAQMGAAGAVVCSSRFSSITNPTTGVYCFTLTSPPPTADTTTALVSIEWGASTGVVLFAQWDADNVTCGGSSHSIIEVRTYKGDTGGVGSGYQTPVLSPEVAFVVYVP
jgi:hypothetical protein